MKARAKAKKLNYIVEYSDVKFKDRGEMGREYNQQKCISVLMDGVPEATAKSLRKVIPFNENMDIRIVKQYDMNLNREILRIDFFIKK